MRRSLFCISLSLLAIYNNHLSCFAMTITSLNNLTAHVYKEPTSSPASPYETVCNEMYYAANGTLPSAQHLADMEAALSAAHAPTNVTDMAAAYSTNAQVKSVVDGLCPKSPAGSADQFVNSVYQNVTGAAAPPSGMLFWSNAITNGGITPGDAALAMLEGAQSLSNIDTSITTAKLTVTDQFTTDLVTQELDIDTSSNTWIQWAHDHPILATTLATTVVAGIIAISVAVPVGVSALHAHQNEVRATNSNNQAAVDSYLNYVRSQQTTTTTVVTSSPPV